MRKSERNKIRNRGKGRISRGKVREISRGKVEERRGKSRKSERNKIRMRMNAMLEKLGNN